MAAGSAPGVPADVQMSAADVDYVVNWEQQTGIRLNLAFNGIGACTADTAADESDANCTGSVTDNGVTYTDPGQVVDSGYPDDAGLVNALLKPTRPTSTGSSIPGRTCSSAAPTGSPSPSPRCTASSSGGTFSPGSYSYEITAATAYGESEPSDAPVRSPSGPTGRSP